jgi:hypothetical protein
VPQDKGSALHDASKEGDLIADESLLDAACTTKEHHSFGLVMQTSNLDSYPRLAARKYLILVGLNRWVDSILDGHFVAGYQVLDYDI